MAVPVLIMCLCVRAHLGDAVECPVDQHSHNKILKSWTKYKRKVASTGGTRSWKQEACGPSAVFCDAFPLEMFAGSWGAWSWMGEEQNRKWCPENWDRAWSFWQGTGTCFAGAGNKGRNRHCPQSPYDLTEEKNQRKQLSTIKTQYINRCKTFFFKWNAHISAKKPNLSSPCGGWQRGTAAGEAVLKLWVVGLKQPGSPQR